jgi:Coenzyme PQQ synthesis protein D (PqqD)
MKKSYPLSRKSNIVVQELDGEVLIYDLIDNKAFCLNETSALIWQFCDGNKSVNEISQLLGEKLNTSTNEDLVWLAIDQLKKEKLIENDTELSSPFQGMNRRQVIKKVGLGTMIALPIIASLTAPLAIHAVSACNITTSCTCTTDGMTAGQGNPCAAAGTAGCNSFLTCVCKASTNGNNNFTGMCAL